MLWYRCLRLTKMLKIVIGYAYRSWGIRANLYKCISFLGHVYDTIWSIVFKVILSTYTYNWISTLTSSIPGFGRDFCDTKNIRYEKVGPHGSSGPHSLVLGSTVHANPYSKLSSRHDSIANVEKWLLFIGSYCKILNYKVSLTRIFYYL